MTPLMHAAKNDKSAIAQLLLQAGADKEAKDKVSTHTRCSCAAYRHVDAHFIPYLYCMQFNKTPLLISAKNGLAAISQILLQAGADKDVKDDVSRYKILIHYMPLYWSYHIPNLYNLQYQKTPLHLAVAMGNIDTVTVFVQAGANVDAKDKVSSYYWMFTRLWTNLLPLILT